MQDQPQGEILTTSSFVTEEPIVLSNTIEMFGEFKLKALGLLTKTLDKMAVFYLFFTIF